MLGVEMEPDYRAPVPEKVHVRAAARGRRPGRHATSATRRFTLHAGRGARHRRASRLGPRRAAPAAHRPARHASAGSLRLGSTPSGSRSRVEGHRRRAPAAGPGPGGHRRADDRAGEHVALGARPVRLALLPQPPPGAAVRATTGSRKLDVETRPARQPGPDAERRQPAEGAVRPHARPRPQGARAVRADRRRRHRRPPRDLRPGRRAGRARG